MNTLENIDLKSLLQTSLSQHVSDIPEQQSIAQKATEIISPELAQNGQILNIKDGQKLALPNFLYAFKEQDPEAYDSLKNFTKKASEMAKDGEASTLIKDSAIETILRVNFAAASVDSGIPKISKDRYEEKNTAPSNALALANEYGEAFHKTFESLGGINETLKIANIIDLTDGKNPEEQLSRINAMIDVSEATGLLSAKATMGLQEMKILLENYVEQNIAQQPDTIISEISNDRLMSQEVSQHLRG